MYKSIIISSTLFMALSQVARWDIDYLRWLSRHSSGIRFKSEIDQLLQSRGAANTA